MGSHHTDAGTAEYLCLHNQPEFLQTTPGQQTHRAKLYGTEYEAVISPPAFSDLLRHDAPCSVCHTPSRSTKITIPGRITCPDSWTEEYHGYIMGEGHFTQHRSRVPICVDVNAESIPGSAAETVTSLLYFMETTCMYWDKVSTIFRWSRNSLRGVHQVKLGSYGMSLYSMFIFITQCLLAHSHNKYS